jgi:hypothetical protein
MFVSSDFAMMRTSGEYIALSLERQWKSVPRSKLLPALTTGGRYKSYRQGDSVL